MTDNPLSKFYRQPALYLKLPSKGKYWAADSLNMPENGELPVLPMSGKDDMALRNADGLMNGASTVAVIQSCFPNIKDAWKAPSIDMDALMIGIRLASYGNKMNFETKCTKCSEELSYDVDLAIILDTIKTPDYSKPIEVNGLMLWFKPSSYSQTNESSQDQYTQQRTLKNLQADGISDEDKIKLFKEAVLEMTAKTVAKLAGFVDYIITPEGEKVTDPDFIKQFIDNADQATYNTIREALLEYNKAYTIEPIQIKCNNCGHADTRQFQFDPSNFFG